MQPEVEDKKKKGAIWSINCVTESQSLGKSLMTAPLTVGDYFSGISWKRQELIMERGQIRD